MESLFNGFECPKILDKKQLAKEKKPLEEGEDDPSNDGEDHHDDPEQVYFTPRVSLPLVETTTLEEDEDVVVEMRARLYIYDEFDEEEEGPEWKERGTGLLKILRHKDTHAHRVLMRRDTTYKVCANHYITSGMKLENHNKNEKAFVYSTAADLYQEEASHATFAVRFRTSEIANQFKDAFNAAVTNDEERNRSNSDSSKEDAKEVDNLAEDFDKKVEIEQK